MAYPDPLVSWPKTPTTPSPKPTATPNSKPPIPVSPTSSRKSPSHIGPNKRWIQEQQRRTFMHHLSEWSLRHDSSPYFHGKISILPQSSREGEAYELGKSVNCILTDSSFTDARKKIVIRLFPPQKDTTRSENPRRKRNDSKEHSDPFNPTRSNGDDELSLHSVERIYNHYTLVVRSGSGWISAREYFSKIYFTARYTRARKSHSPHGSLDLSPDASLQKRSQTLGPLPAEKDSVTIRPLFRPFLHLPPELQEMILLTAVCWTKKWNLSRDRVGYGGSSADGDAAQGNKPPIDLGTMFCISRKITERMRPWIYRSTDFSFGITGFTSFLWSLCPSNRPNIRRLTFHFHSLALLHCLRWLSPDAIFALFEPPVNTNPPNLQFFWRMQLQDLMREVHLQTLTLDIAGIPVADIPFVVKLLVGAFGSVKNVLFVETLVGGLGYRVERVAGHAHWVVIDQTVIPHHDHDHDNGPDRKPTRVIQSLDKTDERLKHVGKRPWREMCRDYFNKYRVDTYFLKRGLMVLSEQQFEAVMDCNREFFDDEVWDGGPVGGRRAH